VRQRLDVEELDLRRIAVCFVASFWLVLLWAITSRAECPPCDGWEVATISFIDRMAWCWDEEPEPEPAFEPPFYVEIQRDTGLDYLHGTIHKVEECRIETTAPYPDKVRARYRPSMYSNYSPWSEWTRRAPPMDFDVDGIVSFRDFLRYRLHYHLGYYVQDDFFLFREHYGGEPPEDVVPDHIP